MEWGKTDIIRTELESGIEVPRDNALWTAEAGDRWDNFVETIVSDIQRLPDEGREFPWRRAGIPPWKVYLTEILLQKTRGEAVESVYDEFFTEIKSPEDLNDIEERKLRSIISPLGLNQKRFRTLREAGEMLSEFSECPKDSEVLSEPWRVGPYVVNATLLFGHSITAELIDANIYRYISAGLGLECRQPHQNSDFRSFMQQITPEDAEIARALYLAMIDFDFADLN